jgi:hypothetical protein
LKDIVVHDVRRDKPSDEKGDSYAELLSNHNLQRKCLTSSKWKGTFETAMVTSPPTHWISNLFTALAETNIRPTRFNLKISAPTNMRCLQLSPQELDAVTKTLSQAEILDLTIDEWTRKGSYAENNDRSREELTGLGDLSKAYFSSPNMKELHLSLGNYPCFHEIPKVSLDDFMVLPLSKPHLSVIDFRNIPMKLDEM